MNNLNPMQLLGMLKNGNPQDVAKQIIKQNFSSDPLMQNLLKAVETGKRLILVGDSNQLPSVGAGNVLADIICSDDTCVDML